MTIDIEWELYGTEIKETYTVEAYYCPMTMPTTLQSTYTYDPNMGTTLNIDASAADNGSAELHKCGFTADFLDKDGLALGSAFGFTLTDNNTKLAFSRTDPSLIGTEYEVMFRMTSNIGGFVEEFNFKISFI